MGGDTGAVSRKYPYYLAKMSVMLHGDCAIKATYRGIYVSSKRLGGRQAALYGEIERQWIIELNQRFDIWNEPSEPMATVRSADA